jgi:hypothetical protein
MRDYAEKDWLELDEGELRVAIELCILGVCLWVWVFRYLGVI